MSWPSTGPIAGQHLRRALLSCVSLLRRARTAVGYALAVEAAEAPSSIVRALIDERRDDILAVASRHHGERVRLFGSIARGEERPTSDIDLLVDFSEGSSLFDLIRMSRELEALLGRSVDVISVGGLKPRDSHILAEARDL